MPAPNLTPPYAIELVNYELVDGADVEAFLALCRQTGDGNQRQATGIPAPGASASSTTSRG